MITQRKKIEKLLLKLMVQQPEIQVDNENDQIITAIDLLVKAEWSEISDSKYLPYWMLCFHIFPNEGVVSYDPSYRFGFAKKQLDTLGISPMKILLIESTYIQEYERTNNHKLATLAVIRCLDEQGLLSPEFTKSIMETENETQTQ